MHSKRTLATGSCGAAPQGISVIVPAYNAAATIAVCLAPLLKMQANGEITEIMVIDDGSTDATAALAAETGVRVMPSGGRLGPGGARNVGAQHAHGDVLWFVDADTVAHEDAARVLSAALEDTDVDAVFGAYDDHPTAPSFWSQYKNLVHHHYHRQGDREAETFWAGCGAVRKAEFIAVGGFDSATYTRPSIEDIELGLRMRQRGMRILLVADIQVTHLKVWLLPNLLHTEIFCRALPWSRLIHSCSGWIDSLNVSRAERARSLIAIAFLASVPLLLISPWLTFAMLLVVIAANWKLTSLFRRRRGTAFALAAILFHQIYYFYCAGAIAWTWLEHAKSTIHAALSRRADLRQNRSANATALVADD